jgi:hypothetical protein
VYLVQPPVVVGSEPRLRRSLYLPDMVSHGKPGQHDKLLVAYCGHFSTTNAELSLWSQRLAEHLRCAFRAHG